jgi:hypothetical protein
MSETPFADKDVLMQTSGIAARCGSCGMTGYWELVETAHGPVCKTGDVERALAEKDEQIAKLKAENHWLNTHTYCAYCGAEFDLEDASRMKVGVHIATCPKHPMRDREEVIVKLQARIAVLEEAVAEALAQAAYYESVSQAREMLGEDKGEV